MPPRKSTRLTSTNKPTKTLDSEAKVSEIDLKDVEKPVEYFEFHADDLKVEPESEEVDDLISDDSSDIGPQISSKASSFSRCKLGLSRKLKLSYRKTALLSELSSLKYFSSFHLKNDELAAVAVSRLPPHILRIFDPKLIAEKKTVKNSVAMLATWWKNNIGVRMIPHFCRYLRVRRANKILELKSSLFASSAYEDDSVRLFTIICHYLGIRVRFVHSIDLVPASIAQSSTESVPSKFQYCPRYWMEMYSFIDERWIPVDCVQGLVDEKFKLENKSKPHSFVIGVDPLGAIHDLTEKYASDFQERSFKLRKDEDKWLSQLILYLNSKIKYNSDASLVDIEKNIPKSIEIPKTLSAMKNHPTLMLQSQLKKYEVFYPIQEPVGYFKDEPVFYRDNVKKVRSKDAWLSQCARIVKDGEEPIKLVSLPRKAGAPENEPTGIQPLFGEWQTNPYVPPLIIDGKVPRNDHGNVDLFQPSMLPKGCVHVTLPGAWKVARHLGLDYADACIGFSFHGGRAVPAIHGIVITDENYQLFQAEYKNKLIESFRLDAVDLEKQIAQKWVKIIKNALIARRLKMDSSMSVSESLIPATETEIAEHVEPAAENTVSAFVMNSNESVQDCEIEEFDAI